MWYSIAVQKFLSGIKCPWFSVGKAFATNLDDHKNDLRKRWYIWPVLYNMARDEVERYLNFILKVVVEDATGSASVVVVTVEEFATSEKDYVEMEVVAAGEKNPILTPNHKLTSNGLFLSTMRRARYLISAINMKRAIPMHLRYRNRQYQRSPIFQPDITIFWQPQGR